MLFNHELDKAFVVPDECRAIVRNVSSISEDLIEDTIENDYNDTFSELFSNNWHLFCTFLHCRINTIYVHCR